MAISRYGLEFDPEFTDALIERYMIQHGGQWTESGGTFGEGLIFHFKRYWSLLWPEDSQTWWTDLILKEVLENQFISLVGGASSWKTGTIARIAMMDWSCFPDCTTILMSSTTMLDLQGRIFGETVKTWRNAIEQHDWFPGFCIDHKCVITHEDIEEELSRDIRNSIIGIPCRASTGKFVGMGKYSGRKNRRVWCISDEFQFMELAVLDAQDNLISNGGNLLPGFYPLDFIEPSERGKPLRGYKAVFIGNPNPSRPGNPLDIVSEPENGWNAIPEDGKTKVWDCKKLPNHPVKCRCICLDSLDSPNNDYPTESPRWDNLAGKHKLASYTEGSESYWSQGRGVFKFGLSEFKIITVEICESNHAFDSLFWNGSQATTKIGMCDASYGGGDRFTLGWLEFGKCADDKIRILLHPYWLVPITIRKDKTPEQQGAEFCKEKMESVGVLPENFFFDGRGSLAMAFASTWSSKVNAIEFGGRASDRAAGPDIFTLDPKTKSRRLKLASEHFSKFVSELWWAWRYTVESDQIRGLTMEMVLDAQPREWQKVAGDKIEIESKRDMKKRTGLSPDIADMIVTGIEGARRRGFVIEKLGKPVDGVSDYRWLSDLANQKRRWLKEKLAIHG